MKMAASAGDARSVYLPLSLITQPPSADAFHACHADAATLRHADRPLFSPLFAAITLMPPCRRHFDIASQMFFRRYAPLCHADAMPPATLMPLC